MVVAELYLKLGVKPLQLNITEEEVHMVKEIAIIIFWLLANYEPCPICNPVYKDPTLRLEVAAIIQKAVEKEQIEYEIVLAVIYYESHFIKGRKGSIGEVGLMQCSPWLLKLCKEKGIYDKTQCGVWHLKKQIQKCKSLEKGNTSYITGKSCNYTTEKLKRKVRQRIKLYKQLKKRKNAL